MVKGRCQEGRTCRLWKVDPSFNSMNANVPAPCIRTVLAHPHTVTFAPTAPCPALRISLMGVRSRKPSFERLSRRMVVLASRS
jgi:hypothetical protein